MALETRIADFLARNKAYADNYTSTLSIAALRARGPGPAAIAIVSCSDPRLIPEEFFKFSRLEANVTRNAGGRAVDALRSLIVLDAMAPIGAVLVVHHTDCGLTHVTDASVRAALKERAPSHADDIDGMRFGEIKDLDGSLREDMRLLKSSPYLAPDLLVLGFMYDLETGLLREVELN